MDRGDPYPTPPPASLPPRAGLGLRQPQQQLQTPQRDQSSRTARGGPSRDARFRRSPQRLGRDGERVATASAQTGVSKMRLTPANLPKSLLPVTERKSQEESALNWRPRKDQDGEKTDITPDGGSAGREGRQFTVANVGNNGRIYLRPTVRPAHQRYPQPHFVFPITPPSTAGLDALAAEKAKAEDINNLQSSVWTPSQDPSTPTFPRRTFLPDDMPPTGQRHRRALSDSTVHETSAARESEPGVFKIVITQPAGEELKSKTLEDLDPTRAPFLEVSIPSWRIGTPRFSVRGTPFIRGSSYAPTEEIRSSSASLLNRSPRDLTTGSEPVVSRKPSALNISQAQPPSLLSPTNAIVVTPRLPPPLRATYLSTHLVIAPSMFDALTFKPTCDDRIIVRYSPASGAVTAAAPPRLVAEITSPSFLDYELLSDFFLTFRAFLEPSDLLRMLIARLRWALARDDQVGLVVRVRTFVALRHWILNYFMDDFVVDYSLRVTFCNLLNDFCEELSNDPKGRKVQLKILAELKKCWRRVCAQYWDGPEFDSALGTDVPIAPGGIAGHRNPSLDPSFWEKQSVGPPQLDGVFRPRDTREETSFYADISRAGHIDSVIVGNRPATPEGRPVENLERTQTSPTSILSLDVVSCSFPAKNTRLMHPATAYPLAAHPVEPSSFYGNSEPIATTPKALTGKRVRPSQTHKRNGSLTDSLREHANATEKVLYKNAEFLLTLPYAGSLVRGNLFPPGQAFVECLPPSAAGCPSRQTTVFQTPEPPKEKGVASAMSSQGMKRLLGSVRRALSTKGQGISPTQGNFINISPIGPRGATTNRLPGTAIVPQARPRQNGVRPPVRIDLLGAEVAEDFKKAVREDEAAEAAKHEYEPPAAGSKVPGDMLEYSVANMDSSFLLPEEPDVRPNSDTGITAGSKSILIFDDTMPVDFPAMTGALPAPESSTDAFETFIPGVADPTPPNTPPGQNFGTPRRSSYILGQHIVRPSLSEDPLPVLVPEVDVDVPDKSQGTRPSEDAVRPSLDFLQQASSRPPLSGVRGHARHRSSRSYRSNRSLGHRRYASFHSGIVPQPTIRSFDATTYSGASVDMDSLADVPVPQPLRVLRRRPGGDLRAVTNVGDLDHHHAPLRRSRSVGSLTTFTDSFRSSFLRSPVEAGDSSGFVDVVNSECSIERGEIFSLGAIAEKKQPKRQVSLFSTHSSKPIMRPSFEAEAQKLAQIPDDLDDDGGVESALLKLEGKYEKKAARLSMELLEPREEPLGVPPEGKRAAVSAVQQGPVTREEKKEHRHIHVDEVALHAQEQQQAAQEDQPNLLDAPSQPKKSNDDTVSFLSDGSRESYSSTPLLERGLADDSITRGWTDHSILQGPEDDAPTPVDQQSFKDSQHPSYEFVQKTGSMERIEKETSLPRPSTEHSFLDVESDEDSDLSSEMSVEIVDKADGEAFPAGVTVSKLPTNPLADPVPQTGHPPSPPMTFVQALHLSPSPANVPEGLQHQVFEQKPIPLTPQATPTAPASGKSLEQDRDTADALRNAHKTLEADNAKRKYNVHLPFILAFDSDILAQQFTLIEKDALNEIDWKELIDMRWKNADNGNARSWVDFLRNTDARGVEVVVARFNIMVKWVISEIVLTQDVEERARCIIKYIHIAAHCRRFRNFATMSQIAIALTNQEVSRLARAWALVPPADLRTLHELEALVSPTRNFYALRAEMEGGGAAAADTGCIPFVGIYTHDLLFNAQRPSEIASSPTTAPLVNFERCRIAAAVVKTLLRLIEQSTLYTFQPVEGIIERCLWMGALTDDDIRKHSEMLE